MDLNTIVIALGIPVVVSGSIVTLAAGWLRASTKLERAEGELLVATHQKSTYEKAWHLAVGDRNQMAAANRKMRLALSRIATDGAKSTQNTAKRLGRVADTALEATNPVPQPAVTPRARKAA